MITLSPDQTKAYDAICDWLDNNTKEKPYLTLGGYAGTGKTTIISYLRQNYQFKKDENYDEIYDVPLIVRFIAYTGKAAMNMEEKLTAQDALQHRDVCSTIHKFLYKPVTDEETGEIIDWSLNPDWPEWGVLRLIIVDEASMVPKNIHDDLVALNIPILYVGDHGQLPPVKEGSDYKFNLMENPDLRLETIHRQAEDSPIIRLSIEARRGNYLSVGDYGPGVKKVTSVHEVEERLFDTDPSNVMCLTDLNRRRVILNRKLLAARNLNTEAPTQGARVVCLKNNWKCNPVLFNGQLGTIDNISDGGIHHFTAEITLDPYGDFWSGTISRHGFGVEKLNLWEDHRMSYRQAGNLFDFGYCLTVHKAQGSEANRVFVFGNGRAFKENQRKWLYTAVTRAKKELYICCDQI